MIVFYADHCEVHLPEGHRFPMGKYRHLRHALIDAQILRPDELHPSGQTPEADLARVHTQEHIRQILDSTLDKRAARTLGLPPSPALAARSSASVFGTLAAAHAALVDGIAGNLAGGTHHAFADRGEGFCTFNDLAVTAAALLAEGTVSRVLILDLDVHHGNGTAAIFENEPRVFTCSVHGEQNYPFHKPAGDLDIGLPDGTGDRAYLEAVKHAVDLSIARSTPDIILYQAGVDPLEEDTLGRLSVSLDGLRERDTVVLGEAHSKGIPIVLTLGGGYAKPIEASIAAHVGTYRVARSLW